jgi:uncharacterized membrane protein
MDNKARILFVAVLLMAGLASPGRAGVLDLFKGNAADRAKAAGVVETAEAVKIPLASLASGKALFLSIANEGTEFRYFALKCGEGQYRAALDACDVCYRAKKGYRQEGDKVVCNNCDMKFDSAKIGEKKGGCNPHGLPSAVEGKSLVILKSDIFAGKRYFR